MTLSVRPLIKYLRFFGGKYRCSVCGKPVRKFFRFSTALEQQALRYGFQYDFRRMETLNFDKCNCPFCLASDRERLYSLYLDSYFSSNRGNYAVLDFAPNKYFADYLRSKNFVNYTSCDLYRDNVDLRLDACDMSTIKDESYDIVIFSHILEHVAYPQRALSEIYRILRKNGFAIIMVPLFWDVKDTVEDPSHRSPSDRWKHYGQDDHVRLYSRKDFLSKLTASGFSVDEIEVNSLDEVLLKKNAIGKNSRLYISRKIRIVIQ